MEIQSNSNRQWVQSVLEQYEQPLIRYAAHLCGSSETAKDIVQDTFLKLCAAGRAKVDDHLAPWLYTVCRNRALDVYRKERRMMPLSDALADTRPAAQTPPSVAAEQNERHNQVLQALQTLSSNQQEVIRLKFQDALSYQEISRITGHSVSNVGYLIHMGLKQIRRQLGTQPQPTEA